MSTGELDEEVKKVREGGRRGEEIECKIRRKEVGGLGIEREGRRMRGRMLGGGE